MIAIGPQTLTVGQPTTIDDPAQIGGNPSVGCQIQNSSPYQLSVLALGDVLSIQPFTAQTIEISGQPIQVTPIGNSLGTTPCTVTFVFLLAVSAGGVTFPDGLMVETPPQQDGPLTAAAILATVASPWTPIDGMFVPGPPPFNDIIPIPINAAGMLVRVSTFTNQVLAVSVSAGPFSLNFTVAINTATQFFWVPAPIKSNGDELNISVTFVSGTAGNIFVFVWAVNNVPVTTTMPGQPLAIYKVGGALRVAGVANTNSVVMLPAPPTGLLYRLHRITYAAGASTFGSLSGNPSGFRYSVLNSAVPPLGDVNLDGQLVGEGLNLVSGAGSITGSLTYDLVTNPQVIN